MNRFFLSLLLSFAVAVGLLVGCDSAGTSMETTSDDGSTTLQMSLTDAPGDVTKASVIIDSVSVIGRVPVEGDTTNEDSTDVNLSVLSGKSFEADLTQLEGAVDTLMGKIDIEPGTYSQVRLVTANPDRFDVRYETTQDDTAQANLFIPSGEQTGIKVNFDSPLTVDTSMDTVDVTLDFDAGESFVSRGRAGQTSDYNFKPTVQASVDITGGEN
ncbi:DUF4382 domain-containing protein [Salinibacter grassmerensis]|uniref:DUF4382 domain-containing protein n=1 Tax=Salinibacter grassmerensis TaxID=3040353 RepID=UPI0021E8A72F|nr:DUF4382 domain-containing protein [Salinibacter grassmerensis]